MTDEQTEKLKSILSDLAFKYYSIEEAFSLITDLIYEIRLSAKREVE